MNTKLHTLAIIAIAVLCNSAFSKSTTYNGTSWSNGVPSGSSDVVTISGGTYSLPANITYSSLTLTGGSTFNVNSKTFGVGNITLTNGTMNLGGTNTSPSGNLSLGTATLNLGGATLTLGGNITVTGTSSIVSNGSGMLNATNNTLTINGGVLTLNNSEVVIDDLAFSSNHDINTSNGGFLSFDNSSNHTLTNINNNRHVNGKVRLYTANGNSNTFLFPIGDGTVYSPFIIDPSNVPNSGTAFTHYFEATYVGTISPNKVMDLNTLNSASGYEYWNASASSSSVTGTIGLRYDNNATKTGKTVVNSVTNIGSDLIIAQYVSSQWSGIASSRSANSGITTVLSTATNISPNTSYTLASNNSRTTFTVPLPVNIINFDATANTVSKTVDLKWETTSEENSKLYEILHSTDFVNWTIIGTVSSNGSSNLNQYTFSHLQPSAVNHYKLKEVDMNDQFAFSDIKVVRFNVQTIEKINVYPNPSAGSITIANAGVDATYEIVDFTGKAILSGNFSQVVEMQNLPKGIYTLKVVSEGVIQNERIIVQ